MPLREQDRARPCSCSPDAVTRDAGHPERRHAPRRSGALVRHRRPSRATSLVSAEGRADNQRSSDRWMAVPYRRDRCGAEVIGRRRADLILSRHLFTDDTIPAEPDASNATGPASPPSQTDTRDRVSASRTQGLAVNTTRESDAVNHQSLTQVPSTGARAGGTTNPDDDERREALKRETRRNVRPMSPRS